MCTGANVYVSASSVEKVWHRNATPEENGTRECWIRPRSNLTWTQEGKIFSIFLLFFFSLILSLSPSPCFLSFNSIHEQNFTRTFRDFSCLRNLQFPGRISRFGKIIIFRDRSLPIGNPRYTENVAQKIIPRSIAPVIVTWNKRTEKKEKKRRISQSRGLDFFRIFVFSFLSFFFSRNEDEKIRWIRALLSLLRVVRISLRTDTICVRVSSRMGSRNGITRRV